jgi:hypothetical protein
MNRALLVGINNYPDPNKLNGCVNDINDMAEFITDRCGFHHKDVRMLTDKRATASNILERLAWLLNGIRTGDRILFHYSGHGAQIATRNPKGEADKFDEVICPVDFDFDDNKTMIRDKDFARLFKSVPKGVEFVWISDSCFSGGLTKGILREPKGVSSFKHKHFILPDDICWRNKTAIANHVKPLGMKNATNVLNVALVSGCSEIQESADADINGRFNGALTFYLLQQLKAKEGLHMALSDVVKTTLRNLQKQGFTQHPELLGSKPIGKNPFLKIN